MAEIIVPEKKLIKPGWYKDIPNEEYHRGIGTSSSNLKVLLEQTPEHLRYSKSNPKAATENMIPGTITHSLVLEPDKFDEEIAILPVLNLRTKAAKEAKEEFLALNPGKTIATEAQLEKAECMAKRVLEDPWVGVLLQDIIPETSVYWWYKSMDTYDKTKYKEMLKVRPDGISKNYPILIDLKTTKDGSYSGFIKSIQNFYYHVSAAMYLEGVNQCQELLKECGHIAYTKFIFICVENFEPYAVSAYELSPEYMNIGKDLYRRAMMRLHEGREENWPGYPEGVRVIEPPGYASRGWIV